MQISLGFIDWKEFHVTQPSIKRNLRRNLNEIETRELWTVLKKTYDYLMPDPDEYYSEFYIYSDPTIRAEVTHMYGGGQGESISSTRYYNEKGEKLGEVGIKPNVCALMLTAPDFCFEKDEGYGECADPRIVATDIFVNALAMMNVGEADAKLVSEINEVLNPTFSFDEAFEFLEKNRFIGENSKKNVVEREIREGKTDWGEQSEVWDSYKFPGWWNSRRDNLQYIPPRMRGVYDKFREMWKEYKRNENDR